MAGRDGVCLGLYGVGGHRTEGSVVPWEGMELWDSCAGRKGFCAGMEGYFWDLYIPWAQWWQAAALVVLARWHGSCCLVAQVSEMCFILCRNGVAAKLKVPSDIRRNYLYRSNFISYLFQGVKGFCSDALANAACLFVSSWIHFF